MPNSQNPTALFNEIGIIEQPARAMIQARMPPGILASQFAVLNHLVRVKDGRHPLDLARAFQVPKTTMTHMLAVRERRAWVRHAPNPADGRSKCIWLTEAGAAFRAATIAALAPDFANLTQLRQTMDEIRNPA